MRGFSPESEEEDDSNNQKPQLIALYWKTVCKYQRTYPDSILGTTSCRQSISQAVPDSTLYFYLILQYEAVHQGSSHCTSGSLRNSQRIKVEAYSRPHPQESNLRRRRLIFCTSEFSDFFYGSFPSIMLNYYMLQTQFKYLTGLSSFIIFKTHQSCQNLSKPIRQILQNGTTKKSTQAA